MTTIRIVIIKPAGYAHSEVFREMAETLQSGLRRIGISSEISENAFSQTELDLVLGWHLLDEAQIGRLVPGTILYNLEQLDEQNSALCSRLTSLATKFRIWDYSRRNVEVLRESGFPADITHVPIGYVPELSRIPKEAVQDIDVLFYGSINERRARILQELENRGLKVQASFGVYGAERDALIARAKVVLNLHYFPSGIFEMVRVSYLIANRKAVVAECHSRTEMDEDIRGAVVLVPYEHLVRACCELVRHAERREILESRAFEAITRRDEGGILAAALGTTPGLQFPVAPHPLPERVSKDSDPAVSVVLITRNRPSFLRRALRSLQAQTFKSFEVIVVNDGGSDVSRVMEEFQDLGMRIHLLVHSENRGPSAARNTGILHARGRWISYLDDDDLYYPDHLEVLVATLRRTGAWVAYTDSMRAIEEDRSGEWVVLSRELAMSNAFSRDQFLVENLTPVHNVMHEKACWEICGPHDESLEVLEDWDYWIRLSRLWEFIHVSQATAEVRWRADGANATFEKRDLFPVCRSRIAEKIKNMLQEEKCVPVPVQAIPTGVGDASRTVFLYEPDWAGEAWVKVIHAYVQAFLPGEPVALLLPVNPARIGQPTLEEAQVLVLQAVSLFGQETFPDIILEDHPENLLDTLRSYRQVQWVPHEEGRTEGLSGDHGNRLARSRMALDRPSSGSAMPQAEALDRPAPQGAVLSPRTTVFCAVWHKDEARFDLLRAHQACLDAQIVPVDRIYVFDGGDRPPEWLKGRCISLNEPLGLYEAWNAALALVRTPYVMNLNLDDRLNPEAVAVFQQVLDEGADLVGGDWLICFSQAETDATGPSVESTAIPFHPEWPPQPNRTTRLGSGTGERGTFGPACAWRMALHETLPRYPWRFRDGSPIRIIGDAVWWSQLKQQGKVLKRVPALIGRYHSHPEGQAEFRNPAEGEHEKLATVGLASF
jgi:hypothetical protein